MRQKAGIEIGGASRMAAGPAISVDVQTNFDACRGLEKAWDAFVEAVSGDIFLTYDWCRIWWKYYGQGRSLRVYVFRDGDRWVGLMPMFLERVSIGPVSIRRAKLVGSDSAFGQFRLAIEPEALGPVLQALLKDLGRFSCEQIVLGPVAGRYEQYPELIEQLRPLCGGTYKLRTKEDIPQVYFPLGESHEAWLGRFTASQRTNIRREYRMLERQGIDFAFEAAAEETWEAMFDDFLALHQACWNARGKLGHFGDWPQSERFQREMARTQLARGRLRLFRVRCSDGSRAYSINYRGGDMYFGLLLARTREAPKGVSLGRLLYSETVRQATAESVGWIDAMRGSYDYKVEMGGEYYPMRLIFLDRRGLGSAVRLGLFRAAARVFNFLYRRIWYYHLAVRLPIHRRKGLWRSWIRACGL